jgi:Xaa-Pro aminopeptidase
MVLSDIQKALRQRNIDGWLLCDFRNRDFLSYAVLGLDVSRASSRRWYYYIPARGTPKALVHAVEPRTLDDLPGSKAVYVSWKDLHSKLRTMLGTKKKIGMQYSPKNNVPFVSLVDAGTIELVKGFGHRVVSSADLVQTFVSTIDENGYKLHKEAGRVIDRVLQEAFEEIRKGVESRSGITDHDIQQFILERQNEQGVISATAPLVGINDRAADPHFELEASSKRRFSRGDTVLIDLYGKRNLPGAIYYDITWVGFVGPTPPPEYQKIFRVASAARDAAVEFVQDRIAHERPCYGWEVDDVCRAVVVRGGYGKYFVHRTGHSIGSEMHGTGVNIDNLETRDERALLPGCCFSIEPGIYLEGKMAVRTEVNIFIRPDHVAEVTGDIQREIVTL